jgi:hypothetical protein
MDERKRRIDDLEKNMQESRVSLDTLLESFGESLYSRTKDMRLDYDDIVQYNVYHKDIVESNTTIVKIEEKNRRFRELVDTIETREQEEKDRAKELAGINRKLGKALLANEDYANYTLLFREQADALASKLESLEHRIGELENREGGNVFSWIGKSAQGLVLRSFLSKAQESQEQLYFNIGERFHGHDLSGSKNDEVAVLYENVENLRRLSRSSLDEILLLKNEKQMISAGFDIEGNPQKQIQAVKNHITQIRDKLSALYRTFGAQASGIMDAEISPERKYFIDTIVTAEDGEIIGRGVRLNQSIQEQETAIGKLRASLAIDDEKSKIEKYRRLIDEKKRRIEELESDIVDLEHGVRDSQSRIQELEKML